MIKTSGYAPKTSTVFFREMGGERKTHKNIVFGGEIIYYGGDFHWILELLSQKVDMPEAFL